MYSTFIFTYENKEVNLNKFCTYFSSHLCTEFYSVLNLADQILTKSMFRKGFYTEFTNAYLWISSDSVYEQQSPWV